MQSHAAALSRSPSSILFYSHPDPQGASLLEGGPTAILEETTKGHLPSATPRVEGHSGAYGPLGPHITLSLKSSFEPTTLVSSD